MVLKSLSERPMRVREGTTRKCVLETFSRPACWCGIQVDRAPQHNPGSHFSWFPVLYIRPEFPLSERVADGFGLIEECAEKVNVLYLALLVDDGNNGDRIKLVFHKGQQPCGHICVRGVTFEADRKLVLLGAVRTALSAVTSS